MLPFAYKSLFTTLGVFELDEAEELEDSVFVPLPSNLKAYQTPLLVSPNLEASLSSMY